jgi:hypothetical protein
LVRGEQKVACFTKILTFDQGDFQVGCCRGGALVDVSQDLQLERGTHT